MNSFESYQTPRRRSASRRRRQGSILFVLMGVFLSFICVGTIAFALYLGGFNPLVLPFHLTATSIAQRNASCQVLIDKAIQASGSFCDGTSSNNVCYGNTSLQAQLVADSTRRFSERGDIITVNELQRLSAAPLNLDNDEWGIAVFKLIANLPRSLPGETVTMIVFGNTTLDNESGNLESFYFYSDLGQIVCEAVPYDGLLISAPNGTGIRINVNGTELTLMGTASLRAVKDQEMEVSLFSGWARIVSNGQEQYFGAGQKVSVGLGGENGVQSVTGPLPPEPLTQQELNTACSVTGQFCSPAEIIPVTSAEAQQQLQSQITFTPTSTITQIPTVTLSPTLTPSSTTFVLPSWTPRWTATPTPTLTPRFTATRTRAPTSTMTRTFTPTSTPTVTSTPTATTIPTDTPVAPNESTCGSVSLGSLTNAPPNQLAMVITNGSGGSITIDEVFAYWVKSPTSQKLDKLFLDGDEIWNRSDPDSPSDIPADAFINGADRTIDATPGTFVMLFSNDLQPGDYEVHIVFNSIPPCQVSDSITLP